MYVAYGERYRDEGEMGALICKPLGVCKLYKYKKLVVSKGCE